MKKFTLLIASLFITIGAMAQTNSYTRIADFDAARTNSKVYALKTTRSPLYFNTEHNELAGYWTESSQAQQGDQADATATAQQFAFLRTNNTEAGKYYMYSVEGQCFITTTGAKSEEPEILVSFADVTDKDDANHQGLKLYLGTTGNNVVNVTYWNSNTAGGVRYNTNTEADAGNVYELIAYDQDVDLATVVAAIEAYEETPQVRTEYVYKSGNTTEGGRYFSSFTLSDGVNDLSVSGIQTEYGAVYSDKTAQKLTTTAGATLNFTEFSWTGYWMHAYAYIDYNKDYYFNTTANNNGDNDGEVVSYNYLDGYDITGATVNAGSANSGTYNESKGMPAFTLPADLAPGEYRMRVKIDWNSLDADNGSSDLAKSGCQCDITLVIVPSYTLNVTAAGYATLYLDYPAAIPTLSGEGCGVYIATDMQAAGWMHLEPITGVIPANTGVIVKTDAGTYEFVYSSDEAANVDENLLSGSVEDTYVEGNALVLGWEDIDGNGTKDADEVGLYWTKLNKDATGADGTTHFKNNANRAYLPSNTTANNSATFYGFDWNGTTGIDEITENRVQSTVIYDLTGRRVETITEPGIYIVGGKKVLVK